jgi:hypothetical protein
MVDEQGAEVIGRPSCGFAVLVESFVGYKCLPAGERG